MLWWDLRCLRSKDWKARCGAIDRLSGSKKLPIIKALAAAVRDPDPRVRTAALYALQDKHEPCIGEALLQALRDVDAGVRRSAVRAILESSFDLWIVQRLLELGDDLRPILPELVVLLLKTRALSSTWNGLLELLRRIGDPQIIQFLLEAIPNPDSTTQQALMGDPRNMLQALQVLDPNWQRSEHATAAVPALVKVLRPKAAASFIREVAVWALVKIRDDRVVEWMTDWVENAPRRPQLELIQPILEGLLSIDDQRAIHPLVSILKMGNSDYDEPIIAAIGRLVNRFAPILSEDDLKELAAVKDGSSTKPRYRTEFMDMDLLRPMELEVPDGTYTKRVGASHIRKTAELELNRRQRIASG